MKSHIMLLFHSLHGVGMWKTKIKCYITFCKGNWGKFQISCSWDIFPGFEIIELVLCFYFWELHMNYVFFKVSTKIGDAICVFLFYCPPASDISSKFSPCLLPNPYHMEMIHFHSTGFLPAVLASISLNIISTCLTLLNSSLGETAEF